MRFFVLILIACLLGSCASVNKGVFIKRKYNKGYYLNIASHKRSNTPKERDKCKDVITKPETSEIVVADNDPEPLIGSVSKVNSPQQKTLVAHNNAKVSNSALEQSDVFDRKENVKEKLVLQVQKQRSSISDTQIGVGLILFLVLTIIYTLVLVINNPAFPILLAIPIAMIGALLTLLTGVMFI